jgi:8-oxo-dGTP diphosphatase
MKREYPEHPIIGVGGVIFRESAVLLALRGQEPGKGEWSLPGGAVELGESLTDALKREIGEEVSIGIEIGGLIRVLERIIYDREKRVRFHYVIADYWGWTVSGEPRAASDIRDARFFDLNRIGEMAIHEDVKETVLMGVRMREDRAGAGEGGGLNRPSRRPS